MSPTRTIAPAGGFAELGLASSLIETIATLGYEEPTPVQRATIPLMLSGRDLLVQAATGTGKTAAFALPMIHLLTAGAPAEFGAAESPATEHDRKAVSKRAKGIHEERPRLVGAKPAARAADTVSSGAGRRPRLRGVVLVPTRELAMQVCEAIHRYARGSAISVVPLYGGSSMDQQIRALQRGVDVVVATPGRALDHIRRRTLMLDTVSLLVLDEADEMLDMGFADDIDAILEQTPPTRQTTLFSATMPSRILKIAERHLTKPQQVKIAGEKTAVGKLPRIRQVAYIVRRDQKPQALDRILDMENPTSAIVFCRTRIEVDTLVETLNAHGYRAEALHGGMMQRQRDAVMGRVRAHKTDLLIATDVAARGLDIEHLSHVVNYDLPPEAESYVHRIGRTGRAGREGTAIALVEPREHRLLKNIEFLTKQKIEVATIPTVADLRTRRLELTKASVRERLVAADFDDVRVVVESLSDEFDIVDIAAAAVKLAHAALTGDGDEADIAAPEPHDARSRATGGRERGTDRRPRTADEGNRGRDGGARRRGEDSAGPRVRLFIGAGRRDGIRPGDLVGAITGEAGVTSDVLGAIQITDGFSLIEVPELIADEIVRAMKQASLRGKKVTVRRDRDA